VTNFQFYCAVSIAMATPLMFVIIRHEVRLSRLRALFEFDQLFKVSQPAVPAAPSPPRSNGAQTLDPATAPTVARDVQKGEATSGPAALAPSAQDHRPAPTFEYVRARYTDDIEFPDDFPSEWIRTFDMSRPRFRAFVRNLKWWDVKSSRSLLLASLPLVCFIAFGLIILFGGSSTQGAWVRLFRWEAPALLAAGTPNEAALMARNVTVVAEAAFLGAYLFILLLFLRALATFDLTPLTVLRGTIYFVIGIVATTLVYLAFPDLPAQAVRAAGAAVSGARNLADSVTGVRTPPAAAAPPASGVTEASAIWIVLAFLMGFTPDVAVNAMISRVQRTIRLKATDDRYLTASPSTPLEIIDGIDVLTRFRLQESNIFEVQNLAVTNPVLLFVETPYGIYEVIDWIAQAQLCTAVGPSRFLELRRHCIRTIFDLERAVLSVYTTSQLRRFVASILLAPAPEVAPSDSGITVNGYMGLAAKNGGPVEDVRAGPAFAKFTAGLFSDPAILSDGTQQTPDPDETIKHFVRTLVDDLHICRVRQLWQQIMATIDTGPYKNSDRLWDTEWLPNMPKEFHHPAQPTYM
jgi:hypothetical protein